MTRKPVTIGSNEFKFQKDALEFYKEILTRVRANAEIKGEDHEHLLALIERHPDAVQKIGVGITYFYKAPTEMGTSCFWIHRIDGSKTDFSYLSAVTAKSKSLYQKFADACRHAVRNDLRKTKEEFFKNHADEKGCIECEVSGNKITIYESHLDHKKPLTFQVIVITFIHANQIEINNEMLSLSVDGQFETEFLDLSLKEKFREFHHRVAQLRIINPKANLSLGGSERILKSKRPVIIITS